MTDNNDFDSLLSKLQQLKNSKDYLSISNTLDHHFHPIINNIIQKWISNGILSNEEKEFFDLYSNLQLSFVEYCFFNSDTTANIQTMITKFPGNLFKKTQTDVLADAVAFIRKGYFNNSNDSTKEDLILVYIMRMLDARSLAYRLCFKDLISPPRNLNSELHECLTHRQAKNYLYGVKSMDKTNTNMFIDSRHKFFIGCCTYAIALFDENKGFLKNDDQNKYICLLAKYVRSMLNQKNFQQDKSILYCLRGVLALLNNCVPTDNWLPIINKALANENDDDAQQANPFNIDLFSLIINRLLGSNILRDKAIQSNSYDATSLVDVALIFLNKWFDTSSDLDDDDDDDNDKNNNKSVSTHEPNQVLRLLRSNIKIGENVSTSQIIIPYFEAKYDRLRLMAISTLSVIMSYKDFKDLEKKKINMAKDIVTLIFHFIDRAVAQETHQYKGISFERLLCYLLRFLVQDTIKAQTVLYVSQIIDYAKSRHIYALKILRKLSTSPDIQKLLLQNANLEGFLKTDADHIYKPNQKMYKYIEDIRQNLTLQEQNEPLSKEYNHFKK
jgi:hypothetical protein